jgi:hypothetical protein
VMGTVAQQVHQKAARSQVKMGIATQVRQPHIASAH